MQRSVEVEGRTLEEATEAALRKLGADNKDVDLEILDDGKAGFLGFGSRNARVKATLRVKQAPLPRKKRPEQAPAAERRDKKRAELSHAHERPPVEAEGTRGREIERTGEPTTDGDVEQAKELLGGFIERMQMGGVIETGVRDERIILNIVGEDSNLLIGKKGQTLDALQFLLNLMYSKSMKKKVRLVVDVEDYKVRREKRLQSIALEVSDKVKRTGKPIAIAPMNSHDRRVIHVALQNDEHVKTVSKGEGLLRKVVVIPR